LDTQDAYLFKYVEIHRFRYDPGKSEFSMVHRTIPTDGSAPVETEFTFRTSCVRNQWFYIFLYWKIPNHIILKLQSRGFPASAEKRCRCGLIMNWLILTGSRRKRSYFKCY
jgi:hypothetical protein